MSESEALFVKSKLLVITAHILSVIEHFYVHKHCLGNLQVLSILTTYLLCNFYFSLGRKIEYNCNI